MEKDFLTIVKTRRSTRQFSAEPLCDEIIQKILEMAAYAPSSWGGHPIEYIVVRNRETLAALAQCKAMGAGSLAYGEAAIVPIIDKRNLELWVEDSAVASTYILLAAEYYGIGACWIHMKDRGGHTGMAEDDIRSLLDIPNYFGILNVVSLGMKKQPSEERSTYPKVHYERYSN